MLVQVLINMISVLPTQRSLALDSVTIRDRYYNRYPAKDPIEDDSKLANVRRCLREMCDGGLVVPIQGASVEGSRRFGRGTLYYLKENSVPSYFMNSKAALSLLWSRRLLMPLAGALGDADPAELAEAARLSDREKVLRDRIRIVPDGIGRADVVIDPKIVRTAVEALEVGRMVSMVYENAAGMTRNHELSVIGLATKDGTIYLIGAKSMDKPPVHFAMQRIKDIELLRARADLRPDFDIDRCIESQHQFSHQLESGSPPVRLELLVHRDALFHFKQRPLLNQDPIEESNPTDEVWHRVTATVPETIQLAPFLWSHAGWVKVLSPQSVRDRVAKGARAAAAHYVD